VAAPTAVRGERSVPLIASPASLQSRISNLLAMALMLAIGVAFLSWYYGHAAMRPARARQSAQAALAGRAQAEMALPSLGPIPAPASPVSVADVYAVAPSDAARGVESPLPSPLSASTLAPLPSAAGALRPTALERRLSGAVFASASTPTLAPDAGAGTTSAAVFPAAATMLSPAASSLGSRLITGAFWW